MKIRHHHHLPLIAMILIQFIYTALFLLNKVAISSGMKPTVFVAYRQAVATFALTPAAYFFDRRSKCASLTWPLLVKIFVISTFGMGLSLEFYYVSLNYISATLATAFMNALPAFVFIISLLSRVERVDMRKKEGQAKVIGTVVCISGAMVYTLYKGPGLLYSGEIMTANSIAKAYTKQDCIKGSLFMLGCISTWATWLVMQSPILKEFPAKLRLMNMEIGFSCISVTIYGAVTERELSSWKLSWDVNLLAVAYAGIIVTAVTYTVQVWVVEKRGPVYTSIFSPLGLILTAFLSAVFFHEALFLGSVLGGGLLIIGLYAFLWGKNKEAQIFDGPSLNIGTDEAQLKNIADPVTRV